MAEALAAKINKAVHDCLGACYASPTPLKAIADYINELDTDPNWSQAEIDEVERAVLQMLVKIAARPPDTPTHDPLGLTGADSQSAAERKSAKS